MSVVPTELSAETSSAAGTTANQQKRQQEAYNFSTLCATVDNPDANHKDQWGSSSVPIYQTTTFKGGPGGAYDYSRSGNPTRKFLEHHVAKISGAQHAFAVNSGMAAMDVIFRLLKPGEEVVAGNDLYGGSNRLLTYLKNNSCVVVHHISTTSLDAFYPLLQQPNSKIRWVLLETPTNPLLQIADIKAISDLVHKHIPEALVVVDNTMMSPYLARPLELGADIIYDSATKYLSGHHDLMAGMIVCNSDEIAKRIYFTINTIGNALSAFDSFLLLRGTKTLALRMNAQQANAQRVAEFLDSLGFPVLYPGLPSHPGKDIHDKQSKGAGGVLSFRTDSVPLSEAIVNNCRLWGISVSFGCVNSLISMPCQMSHASIDPKVRKERNLPEDLIRLCVGIEDADDLIDDLKDALIEAGAISQVEDPSAPNGKRCVRVVPSHETQSDDAADPTAAVEGSNEEELCISAPGKVILFGEHAVVHGATAVAGSVDLRCYCSIRSRSDDKVTLSLPDARFEQTWNLSDIPFSLASEPDATPVPELMGHLAPLIDPQSSSHGRLAAMSFLYLFSRLAKPSRRACTFVVRSALPIGAGLGSSAAYSVCITAGLLYAHRHISLDQVLHLHQLDVKELHHGRRVVPTEHSDLVNAWAFVAEKINHGAPSGVDNTIATMGSALAFKKGTGTNSIHVLHGFKSLRFLLTDTQVPKNTKAMVAAVSQRKQEEPERIGAVLKAIDDISLEAQQGLTDSEMPRDQQVVLLKKLIEENGKHLETLGVSHPTLETIKVKTAAQPYGLSSKLTGAGGGGCAVTLIPDDFARSSLEALKAELQQEGFKCYEASVGGSGFGVLLPKGRQNSQLATEQWQKESMAQLVPQLEGGGQWLFV